MRLLGVSVHNFGEAGQELGDEDSGELRLPFNSSVRPRWRTDTEKLRKQEDRS